MSPRPCAVMTSRKSGAPSRRLSLFLILIAACSGAQEPVAATPLAEATPRPRRTVEPAEEMATPVEETAPPREAPSALPPAVTVEDESLAMAQDLGEVDHTATRCPWGRTRHEFRDSMSVPGFELRQRASLRRRGHQWRMRPGQVLRFEETLRNTGSEPVVVTQAMASGALFGMGPPRSSWRSIGLGPGVTSAIPWPQVRAAGPLSAGQRLAPGAMLRFCAEFRVPESPTYAFFPGRGQEAITYYFGDAWGGVTVPYPAEAGAAREPTSWGGIVRVRLREGANLLEICRQEQLRPPLAVSFGPSTGPPSAAGSASFEPATETFVQVPKSASVADAIERLLRRGDVESASALHPNDPGTESCDPDASCGVTGQICCYVYGFSGCGNPTCYVHPHTPPLLR